jgi:hypothetical protein
VRLTKILLRCRLNAVGVSAETGDVEIGLHNFVFGVALLDTNRELHLVELALNEVSMASWYAAWRSSSVGKYWERWM